MSTVSDVMTNNSYTTPEKSYKNNALGADLLTPHATPSTHKYRNTYESPTNYRGLHLTKKENGM